MQRSETTTPDEFLASLPDGTRQDLQAVDAAIAPVFAGQERVLWEGVFWGGTQQQIIGYGAYTYRGRSGATGEWFIVGLAAQKGAYSLYVNAVEDGQNVMKRYGPGLGKAKLGSAVASFRKLEDMNLPAVVELAKRARNLVLAG
jgi:hypothetical protein